MHRAPGLLVPCSKCHARSAALREIPGTGLEYVRQISVCLTSSAVILVPFPIVLLPEVLLAVSAVPGVPGAPSAGSFSALS